MIVRNWTNINKNSFNIDISNLDITYNNKPILIQIPKGRIISHPQVFNNPKLHFLNVSLSYNNNDLIRQFNDFINELELHIISMANSKFKTNLSINSSSNKVYFNLTIQIYNNEAIISIFDPYKKKQNMNYIIPQSNAICLITPKNLWKSKDKIGINWVLVQAKIFQPIIKIDECLIMDEFDEQPLLNYHNNERIELLSNDKDTIIDNSELEEKYNKFLKMKKMGVPIGAIEIEMLKDSQFDINEFLKLIGEPPRNNNIPPKPMFKLVLPKPKTTDISNRNTSGQASSSFRPPSKDDIQNMLAKLKKTPKKD
jgi:hypothetical protein